MVAIRPESLGTTQVRPVVFFDGVCGLCNASVDWIMERDVEQRFRFSPLQGSTAAAAGMSSISTDSLVYIDHRGVAVESTAASMILRQLPGLWSLVGATIGLLPGGLGDAMYRTIATNRYAWFGVRETCRIPSPEERERFLP